VGTGFERSALESLRRHHQGDVFDADSLTEDYESGFLMHAAGYRQIFVPLRGGGRKPVATREYFPRRWREAIRQRSRWVSGVALQGWQNHGWRVPSRQAYWLWRDRKGLAGNFISPLANLLFFYTLLSYVLAAHGHFWHLGSLVPGWLPPLCLISAGISMLQISVRVHLSARLYGWRFAAAAPLRSFWGNLINCAATAKALRQFLGARVKRHDLVWCKTAHVYPGDPFRIHKRPRLGEVLVRLRCISTDELEEALRHRPLGQRIGEYLVEARKITEANLSLALSSQSGLPLEALSPGLMAPPG